MAEINEIELKNYRVVKKKFFGNINKLDKPLDKLLNQSN